MATPARSIDTERIRDGERPLPRRRGRRLRLQVGDRLRRDRRGPGAGQAAQGARRGARATTRARSRSAPAPATSALNLLRAGRGRRTRSATDISPGMLRAAGRDREASSGSRSRRPQADAEALPFADESFDLVLGHAVLHHLPGLDRAMSEFHRVLAPGGTLAFMGEPSRHGDRLAVVPKRLGGIVEPAWRRAMRAAPKANGADPAPPARATPTGSSRGSSTCTRSRPATCTSSRATPASPTCGCRGEELLANVYGWFLRRLESDVDADDCAATPGTSSRSAATWRCSGSTARCSSRGCRRSLFYNLLVSGRRPG